MLVDNNAQRTVNKQRTSKVVRNLLLKWGPHDTCTQCKCSSVSSLTPDLILVDVPAVSKMIFKIENNFRFCCSLSLPAVVLYVNKITAKGWGSIQYFYYDL